MSVVSQASVIAGVDGGLRTTAPAMHRTPKSERGAVVTKAFDQLMQSGADLRWRVVALATLKDIEIHMPRRENHVGRVHRVVDVGLAGCNRLPQQVFHVPATSRRTYKARQNEARLQAGELWKGDDIVFTNNLGEHLTPDQVRRALLRALKEAGLPRIRPHDLRHTHASALLRLRTPMKVVQERLGHSSFAVTADIYSHVSPDLQEQAAGLFGAALRAQPIDGEIRKLPGRRSRRTQSSPAPTE